MWYFYIDKYLAKSKNKIYNIIEILYHNFCTIDFCGGRTLMENLCMNCMEKLEGNHDICPFCGKSADNTRSFPFIPPENILAERYLIGRGLELDGEGLSYIGYDISKKSKVYIREFYPSNFCSREKNSGKVKILANAQRIFKGLLEDFLKYFRAVAKLRNLPGIVAVYDIFEENNTAYVVCEWIEGTRLNKYLSSKGGYLEWKDAKSLFMPLISSLSHMESAGVRHLGICPDNIMVTYENKLKLTGFATKNLRSANSLISSQLYDGCSALEQYLDDYESSESTDVYGFTASLFLALTGEYPLSAQARKQNDRLMMSQNILNKLPENVVSAIATALRVYPNSRTLSFETLKIELSDSPILRVKNIEEPDTEFSLQNNYRLEQKKSGTNVWGIVSCISALVILLVCLGVYWFWLKDNSIIKDDTSSNISQAEQIIEQEVENSDEKNESTAEEVLPVPNLSGRNYKNLQSELEKSGKYKVALLSEEFHESIGEGCIISQNPSAGQEMPSGSTIAVTVSKGTKKRTLPEITGKTLSEASQLVTNAKLIPTSSAEFSSEFPEGTVIGYRSYKAGDKLDYNSEVVIVVSKGTK